MGDRLPTERRDGGGMLGRLVWRSRWMTHGHMFGFDAIKASQMFVRFGFATQDGYLPNGRGLPGSARISFQHRRSHEKAPSGDLQSGAGTASHCERSYRRAPQLPIVQRLDRTVSRPLSTSATVACDADVHRLRSNGPLYCGSSLVGILVGRSIVRARALVTTERASFLFAEDWQDAAPRIPIGDVNADVLTRSISSTVSPRRGRGTDPWHAFKAQ